MTTTKISLSWNVFDASASNAIQQLWLEEDFTDVTLVTEDERQFKAHKVVLISSSVFFRSLFSSFPHPSPLLFLSGVKSEQMKLLLEFIYLGRCEAAESDLKLLFATGAKLKISGLLEDNLGYVQDFGSDDDKNGAECQNSLQKVFIEEERENYVLGESGLDKQRRELDNPSGGASYLFSENNCNSNIEGETNVDVDPNLESENVQRKLNVGFCKLHQEAFETKESMTEHQNNKHTDTRHFCDMCDKSYAQESNLTLHKESKHEGKRYNCNECNFQSTRKSVLDAHKRFHHKGIGFDCSTCGKKYAQINGLKLHNMKTHKLQ